MECVNLGLASSGLYHKGQIADMVFHLYCLERNRFQVPPEFGRHFINYQRACAG